MIMKKFLLIIIISIVSIAKGYSIESLNQMILFQRDSVNVPEFQIAQMEMMADYFKSHPNEYFFIGGFTSENTPAYRVETICEQRAQAVKKMLVEKFGVDGNYLIAIGVGVSKKSSEPDFNEKVEFFRK